MVKIKHTRILKASVTDLSTLTVSRLFSRSTANFSLSFTVTHGFGRLINNFTGRFNFNASIVILCYVDQLYICMLCMYSYLFCENWKRSW